MGRYTCDVCKYDGGFHYDSEGNASRCPNRAITEQVEQAQELAKLAHENAWAAAQQIMRDIADTMPRFDPNTVRPRFEASRIPAPLIGSAFTWAHKAGLIEPVGDVPPGEMPPGTRSRAYRWVSKVYGRQAS